MRPAVPSNAVSEMIPSGCRILVGLNAKKKKTASDGKAKSFRHSDEMANDEADQILIVTLRQVDMRFLESF
jgi:hypothetical protein